MIKKAWSKTTQTATRPTRSRLRSQHFNRKKFALPLNQQRWQTLGAERSSKHPHRCQLIDRQHGHCRLRREKNRTNSRLQQQLQEVRSYFRIEAQNHHYIIYIILQQQPREQQQQLQ